jgi:hypothetical protein
VRAPVVPTFTPPARHRSFGGGALSMFLHGLLLFVIISPWFRRYYTFSANGSDVPGFGGGGGNRGEQYIALAALRPAARPAPPAVEAPVTKPEVPPPTEVPTEIPPPTPAPDSVPQSQPSTTNGEAGAAAAGTAGEGGGAGGGTGGGQGTGTGTGSGPGTGGSLRGQVPTLRGFPIPPMDGTPRPLRGKDLLVRVFVGIDGRVDRYETEPEVTDGGFRRKLDDIIAGYRFTPARDSTGRAVPGITTVIMTLANK